MNLEQLRVLQAVISEGTFRGAALKLNKSQPAVSHMLKTLEDNIGVELISRAKYRPSLTKEGDVFYRHAAKILSDMEKLSRIAKGLCGEQEAEIHLVLTATCNLKHYLETISRVAQKYPATHIRLSTESMGGPIEQLLEGQAEIIIAGMDGVPADQVEAASVGEVVIAPVAHANHPAALNPGMNTITDMKNHVQVIVSDSSGGARGGAYMQSRDLLPGNLRWTVSDFAAKKEIILAGMGWGGLPMHIIEKELASGELKKLKIIGFEERYTKLHKIRLLQSSLGIVGQALWDELVAVPVFR